MSENISIVMRQTGYDENEAKDKLQQYNNDIMKVIEEYLEIPKKKEEPKIVSVNQEKYRQFRNLVSESNKNIRNNKSK